MGTCGRWSRWGAAAAATLLVAACSRERPQRAGTWVAEIDTLGDTIVVRTAGGSVWGAPALLVEELAIGVLEGREELMFGRVDEIAPDAQGGAYVFDGHVPALRHYDSLGNYVRTLGRRGSGPGEYQDAVLGLAVRRDGRIVMRDPRNARLNAYDPDGSSFASWPVASGLFTAKAMTLDTADHVYLKILTARPERNRPWKVGLLHLDADGNLIDTIPDPEVAGEPQSAPGTFSPQNLWAWSPLGYMIVGVSASYAFELRPPGGPLVRVEKVHDAVAVHPEERAEWEAFNEWYRKNQGRFLTAEIPPVPDRKPAYRGLYVGQDGRIWVHLHAPAEKIERETETQVDPSGPPPRTWSEPTVFDVFEPDGTYLGEARVPRRTSLLVFGATRVWGIRRGEFDEQYVVRFGIEPPRRR